MGDYGERDRLIGDLKAAYETIEETQKHSAWLKGELIEAMGLGRGLNFAVAVVSPARIIATARELKEAEADRDRLRAVNADLVAACRALLESGLGCIPHPADAERWEQALESARAAIAKAAGNTP